jgi:predicted lysophospholipase L1 biosynthesis ABC-type transport system permease subunit
VLGIVSVYGVIAYAVSQRTRKMGIRAALGAPAAGLLGMFVRHGLWLAGIGGALGLVVAAGVTRLMSSLLFGVSACDPVTYVAVSALLITAAVLASYLPARRAMAVDPVQVLRAEQARASTNARVRAIPFAPFHGDWVRKTPREGQSMKLSAMVKEAVADVQVEIS